MFQPFPLSIFVSLSRQGCIPTTFIDKSRDAYTFFSNFNSNVCLFLCCMSYSKLPWVTLIIWSEYCDSGVGLSINLKKWPQIIRAPFGAKQLCLNKSLTWGSISLATSLRCQDIILSIQKAFFESYMGKKH